VTLLLAFWLFENLVPLLRYGRLSSFHTYLSKIRPLEATAALEQQCARFIDLMQVDVEFGDGRTAAFWAASTLAVGYVCDVVRAGCRLPWLGRHAYAAAFTVPRALGARGTRHAGHAHV
jgi:hypothetical protein